MKEPGDKRVGVVIPAFDEEEALPLVLADLPREHIDRIVVVDNASTDRTAECAREGGAEVVYEARRGYGQACLAGIAELLRTDSEHAPLESDDVIVFLDADYSDYPEELPAVLGPVRDGEVDMVIGSRILGGAGIDALLPQARFGNVLACFLMRLFFRARYTDLGPFRAIGVGALESLAMRDTDYGWTVEMQLKAVSFGLRVTEVPVSYRKRKGVSKITGTLRGTLSAGWKILGWITVWRVRLFWSRKGSPTSPHSSRSGTR